MAILGLNHAVLYVRDAKRSSRFYEEVLGFVRVIEDALNSRSKAVKAGTAG